MNAVILGGTGYIGRNVTAQWLARDSDVHIYTVSRKGENQLKDPRVTDLVADCKDAAAVKAVLPENVDVIVDLVGGLGGADDNVKPAQVTAQIAEELNIPKIGYVGGVLGNKEFVSSKAQAAKLLQDTGRKVTVVQPTLVYGNGRSDGLAKMVWFMYFLGLFSKKCKPVKVDAVAKELLDGLYSA